MKKQETYKIFAEENGNKLEGSINVDKSFKINVSCVDLLLQEQIKNIVVKALQDNGIEPTVDSVESFRKQADIINGMTDTHFEELFLRIQKDSLFIMGGWDVSPLR